MFIFGHLAVIEFQMCCRVPNFTKIKWFLFRYGDLTIWNVAGIRQEGIKSLATCCDSPHRPTYGMFLHLFTYLPSVWPQNWLAAYLGYTLQMKTMFRGWPVMVNDTHTRRRSVSFVNYCTGIPDSLRTRSARTGRLRSTSWNPEQQTVLVLAHAQGCPGERTKKN